MAAAAAAAAGGAAATSATSDALERILVKHPSGATCTIVRFGATVLDFTTATGEHVLFTSEKAVFDAATPIRGGIPLVFPQFGPGKLVSHGFARRQVWELVSNSEGAALFRLTANDATKAAWPHDFQLDYHVSLAATGLTTSLTIANTGSGAFEFQALLHTYFAADDATRIRISGLQDKAYLDSLHGNALTEGKDEVITFAGEVDRVYVNVEGSVVISGLGSGSRTVTLFRGASRNGSDAAADVVVWNPWIEKAKKMADFGDEEYKVMCCVEPGRVSKFETLEPSEKFNIYQTINVA